MFNEVQIGAVPGMIDKGIIRPYTMFMPVKNFCVFSRIAWPSGVFWWRKTYMSE
jgi:hypothetical protein